MERASTRLGRTGDCRWAGVGRSADRDPAVAGAAAVRDALDGRDDARLVLLFPSGLQDLDVVAEAAADAAGAVPVAGSSTAVAPQTPAAVVAVALGGDGLDASAVAAPSTDPRDAGVRAAACLGDVAHRPHRLLLLLADGPPCDHADVVRGAYSVAGAGVPLAGGVAAHPLGPGRGAVVHGGSALRGAVVGVAIGADVPLGVGVAHGWEPIGDPLLITAATRGRVLELDDRPAAEVYLDRIGLPEAPTREAVLVHPLARHGRSGPAHVRAVEWDGAADGSLACALDAGSVVSVMRARPGAGLGVVDAAAAEATAALGGVAPQALIAFDCEGRTYVLAQDHLTFCDTQARLTEHAPAAAVATVVTHGEIARTRGIAGLHHQSIAVVAIP